ncbi:MAG: hypothetical protein HYS07_02140 [Chlamydiae bacterium]|nr:hypothetical protein [Chlamydiota bacterium]MBI3276286.1 hypothetical protein [Chlamydiota bacterium]
MHLTNHVLMKNWVQSWKRTGEILSRLKKDELHAMDTKMSIELLEDAFQSALFLRGPSNTSGLIEQQRLFQKLKW